MSTVFASHPPTGDRIIKSEEEIQQILPKRNQYLVSTSEFDDIKARLQTLISQHKRQKGDSGPTLRKRESADKTTSKTGQQQPSSQGDDQPPVLKRRD
jgi:hypothetical protein